MIDSIPLNVDHASNLGVGGNLYSVNAGGLIGTDAFVRFDGQPASKTTGGVTSGFITTAPDGPYHGAIYCVGGGTYDYPQSGPTRSTLTNLSKLGPCGTSGGSDSLSVCVPR